MPAKHHRGKMFSFSVTVWPDAMRQRVSDVVRSAKDAVAAAVGHLADQAQATIEPYIKVRQAWVGTPINVKTEDEEDFEVFEIFENDECVEDKGGSDIP